MNPEIKDNEANIDFGEDNTCISCNKVCFCNDSCCLPWRKPEIYRTDNGCLLCKECNGFYKRNKRIVKIILEEQE